jgi:hypothetical protein
MLALPDAAGGRRNKSPYNQYFTMTILAQHVQSLVWPLMASDNMMLRVETQELDGALVCRLEGRFTGEGAEHVRMLVTQCHTDRKLVVDLTEVMYIDAVGEKLLLLLKRLGAHFVAETSYSRDICERLHLPQAVSQ